MLAYLPLDFWLMMLAFGALIVLLGIRFVRDARRPAPPPLGPVRFGSHWFLLLMLGCVAVRVGFPLVTFVQEVLAPEAPTVVDRSGLEGTLR